MRERLARFHAKRLSDGANYLSVLHDERERLNGRPDFAVRGEYRNYFNNDGTPKERKSSGDSQLPLF